MPDPNRWSPAPSPPLIIYVEKLMRSGRRFVGCYSSVADRLRCVTHKYYATKRNPENKTLRVYQAAGSADDALASVPRTRFDAHATVASRVMDIDALAGALGVETLPDAFQ